VLHLALQHDAACLESSVGVVGKSSRSLGRWQAQLVQHEVGVKVPQGGRADLRNSAARIKPGGMEAATESQLTVLVIWTPAPSIWLEPFTTCECDATGGRQVRILGANPR
jgi:hypothetical protein